MTDDSLTIYEDQHRINAFECDITRHWKLSALFQYLTEAAHHHVMGLGLGFEELQDRGLYWVLSRMNLRLYHMPCLNDSVLIRTWGKRYQQRLFYIRDFEVEDTAGTSLVVGTSAWLAINSSTRRIVPPERTGFAFPMVGERSAFDGRLERLKLEVPGEERLRLRAGYSDLDVVGHVNNGRYVDWICDALPLEFLTQRHLDSFLVNYEHEILLGNEVAVDAGPQADDAGWWAVTGHNCTTEARAFEALLHWQD